MIGFVIIRIVPNYYTRLTINKIPAGHTDTVKRYFFFKLK